MKASDPLIHAYNQVAARKNSGVCGALLNFRNESDTLVRAAAYNRAVSWLRQLAPDYADFDMYWWAYDTDEGRHERLTTLGFMIAMAQADGD